MTSTTMRWRAPPAAWVPIALAIGVEAVSNALRAYGLGAHLDRFTVSILCSQHPIKLGTRQGVREGVISRLGKLNEECERCVARSSLSH